VNAHQRAAGERLATAQALTASQDAKASAVLSAAGLWLTAGGVLTAVARPHGLALVLAGAAGIGLVLAVLHLLAVLLPRGGSPATWLLQDQEPADELAKVAAIAGKKHRHLTSAIYALTGSVAGGVLAVLVAAVTR
jgi:hypothetical protein